VRGTTLRNGMTRSCGCLATELKRERATTHGHATTRTTPTYNSWAQISQRCENKNNAAFNNYGGRGITVCARWRVFENFLADMGERPLGCSLDRVNNDGNYEPVNCRWATRLEQARNRRPRRFYKKPKETG